MVFETKFMQQRESVQCITLCPLEITLMVGYVTQICESNCFSSTISNIPAQLERFLVCSVSAFKVSQ